MKIFIVIPCYNEEAVLPKTLEVLGNLIKTIKVKTDADTELLLVDDGSRDRTWQMISDAAKEHKYVHGIKLSHNRGHQNALWAGMEAAVDHCDAMVSIDLISATTLSPSFAPMEFFLEIKISLENLGLSLITKP